MQTPHSSVRWYVLSNTTRKRHLRELPNMFSPQRITTRSTDHRAPLPLFAIFVWAASDHDYTASHIRGGPSAVHRKTKNCSISAYGWKATWNMKRKEHSGEGGMRFPHYTSSTGRRKGTTDVHRESNRCGIDLCDVQHAHAYLPL